MQNKAKILDKFSDLVGRTVKSVLEDRYQMYQCIWFEDDSYCILTTAHESSRGEYVSLWTDVEVLHYEILYDFGLFDEQDYQVLKAKESAEREADNNQFRREQWEELNKEFGE